MTSPNLPAPTGGFTVDANGELRASFDLSKFVDLVNSPNYTAAQNALALAYDKAVTALVGPNDVQVEGGRSFKKKSAWRKLGRHFGISTRVVRERVEVLSDLGADPVVLATCVVEASAPWGQTAEAVGACGTDEERGNRVITLADAKATAETRATNRAVSNLIAMGEVSAEEMTKGERPVGPSANASETERAVYNEKGPKMPFGRTKGKHVAELEEKDVIGAIEWAEEKGKFLDFAGAARKWLDARRDAAKAAPAGAKPAEGAPAAAKPEAAPQGAPAAAAPMPSDGAPSPFADMGPDPYGLEDGGGDDLPF